ncbi:MAG: hypothetical protein R3F56_07940 [Planctomycetota bacterium]
MKHLPLALLTLALPAQNPAPPTSSDDAVARVRDGGWLCAPKWRRGDDGMLQVWLLGEDAERDDAFVPLLGEHLEAGVSSAGAIGWLALWCQGSGDLIGMTDVEFHLAALGIGTEDAALRQHLLQQSEPAAEARRRAEVFDRMLILDELRRRRCRAAVAEIEVLLRRTDLPPELRQRAETTLADLRGEPSKQARRRLDADKLLLPEQLDLCIVVDHARLPDMSGLTAFGRRVSALATASILAARGLQSPSSCSMAQRSCDIVAELPFGMALRYGNYRLDHSCVAVGLTPDADAPFRVWYQAAGSFDPETWAAASAPAGVAPDVPFWTGPVTMTEDLVTGTTARVPAVARPDLASGLLADSGAAVRVVVPEHSALLARLTSLGFPDLRAAELRASIASAVAHLTLTLDAGSDADAAAWSERGKSFLRQGKAWLASTDGQQTIAYPDLVAACQALLRVEISTNGQQVTAELAVPLPSRAAFEALFLGLERRRRPR